MIPCLPPLFAAGRGLGFLDFGVLVLYLLGMVAIGLYFSRRQTSTDEYLLGKRSMSPFLVGISLIATLLSTITYLGAPGDMIQFGPAFATGILAMPLWLLVVALVWIPFFMRYRLTSIYEYAELRFSRTARIWTASLFVLMRLGWMGMIVYTAGDAIAQMTADFPLALAERFGIAVTPRQWLLLVIVAMAATTTVYTVFGGIRAVVWTDFAQFVLMMLGVIFAVGFIWIQSGAGPIQWWNEAAGQRHEMLRWFSTDVTVERTVFLVVLDVFFWRICIQCSDQVATQRYFSTSGVRSAVRANVVAALADFVILAMFAVLGLALLHYFTTTQNTGAWFNGAFDSQNAKHAKDAFPQFIVYSLPAGLAGLVVAALMSAAMSSLSSGINSISAVAMTDFHRRPRDAARKPRREMVLARWISFVIGLALTAVGTFIAFYIAADPRHQNITDLANRVFNLFVGPLGGLFIVGMFLPWVGNAAVLTGTSAGVAYAIFLSFSKEILPPEQVPSTLWITPTATLATILTSALAGVIFPKPAKEQIQGHTWWTRRQLPTLPPAE